MNRRYPNYSQVNPVRYPESVQIWHSTPSNPWPMNFVQAPSFSNQVLVSYKGQPNLQGLSTVKGPIMFPVKQIAYPVDHSIPDPFNQHYINLAYYSRKGYNGYPNYLV
jgi:hypothetical protein